MSSHRRTVVLSLLAQDDLADILLYSWQSWGEAQRDQYEAAFARAVDDLSLFPEIGASRPELFASCRVRLVEHHVVYYQDTGDVVEIVRILHERTDPARHLQR